MRAATSVFIAETDKEALFMAQDWDYANLSKNAKAAGGPEKYVEIIEKTGEKNGMMKMVPAIFGAVALTAVTMKAIEYFKAKRKQGQAELEQAKQELIDGINQYDAEHEIDTQVGLEVPDDKTETDRKKNDDE